LDVDEGWNNYISHVTTALGTRKRHTYKQKTSLRNNSLRALAGHPVMMMNWWWWW